MPIIKAAQFRTVTVRQEGARVLLLENGRAIADLPWEAALALSKALHIQGKKAEEIANADRIVMDQAILTRIGVPFGLTSHPALLKEATREAAFNSDLRRYIPPKRAGGLASQAVFGAPSVIRHDPKPKRSKSHE